MDIKRLKWSFLLLITIISGCAASGRTYKEFAEAERKDVNTHSRVIFFRPSEFAAGGRDALVSIGGNQKRYVSNGGFASIDLLNSEYLIKVSLPGDRRTCEVTLKIGVPGEQYFFEIKPNSDLLLAQAISFGIGAGFSNAGMYEASGVAYQSANSVSFDPKVCNGIFFIYPSNADSALKKLELIRESRQ